MSNLQHVASDVLAAVENIAFRGAFDVPGEQKRLVSVHKTAGYGVIVQISIIIVHRSQELQHGAVSEVERPSQPRILRSNTAAVYRVKHVLEILGHGQKI